MTFPLRTNCLEKSKTMVFVQDEARLCQTHMCTQKTITWTKYKIVVAILTNRGKMIVALILVLLDPRILWRRKSVSFREN